MHNLLCTLTNIHVCLLNLFSIHYSDICKAEGDAKYASMWHGSVLLTWSGLQTTEYCMDSDWRTCVRMSHSCIRWREKHDGIHLMFPSASWPASRCQIFTQHMDEGALSHRFIYTLKEGTSTGVWAAVKRSRPQLTGRCASAYSTLKVCVRERKGVLEKWGMK